MNKLQLSGAVLAVGAAALFAAAPTFAQEAEVASENVGSKNHCKNHNGCQSILDKSQGDKEDKALDK